MCYSTECKYFCTFIGKGEYSPLPTWWNINIYHRFTCYKILFLFFIHQSYRTCRPISKYTFTEYISILIIFTPEYTHSIRNPNSCRVQFIGFYYVGSYPQTNRFLSSNIEKYFYIKGKTHSENILFTQKSWIFLSVVEG